MVDLSIVMLNYQRVINHDWLVVSTPLKNISLWEGVSHILWKIKNVPNHQPDEYPPGHKPSSSPSSLTVRYHEFLSDEIPWKARCFVPGDITIFGHGFTHWIGFVGKKS